MTLHGEEKAEDYLKNLQQIKDPLLSYAIVIIIIYELIYASTEAFTNMEAKDEDFVNCSCILPYRIVTKVLFGLFSLLWITVVFYFYLYPFIFWLVTNSYID